jgi:hypothetical protein
MTTAIGPAIAPALLQGALVALPRGDALPSLRRLRSPTWAAVLPGAIVVGTFAPLGAHGLALGLIVLAALATPPLAAVAVLAVVRGPRAALVALALIAAVGATFAGGLSAQLSETTLTALGALALGAALVRLIPYSWVLVGFTCMCAVDIALVVVGIGQSSANDLVRAAGQVPGPLFDHAQVGRVTLDYPDLVLTAALGAFVAGQREQRWLAAVVTVLAGTSLLLAPAHAVWPATIPVAATLIAVRAVGSFRNARARRRGLGVPDLWRELPADA